MSRIRHRNEIIEKIVNSTGLDSKYVAKALDNFNKILSEDNIIENCEIPYEQEYKKDNSWRGGSKGKGGKTKYKRK